MTDLENYINQLLCFDWFYEMTDDYTIWSQNNNKMTKLILKAKSDKAFKAAFTAVKEYMSNRFGTNASEQLKNKLDEARNLV